MENSTERERFYDVAPHDRPIREPIRATVYEIAAGVKTKLFKGRWYVSKSIDVLSYDVLTESGQWQEARGISAPKWFDSPEDAADFWYATIERRI